MKSLLTESSFYDYTKVNRGGLFKVSNEAYSLFASIMNTVNGMLHDYLHGILV